MATEKKAVIQDPLGLQRYALTESAYDLINSLIGVYFRLRYKESKKNEPDTVRLAIWNDRVHSLQSIHGNGKWADLFFLEQLISTLTEEYKKAIEEEEAVKHAENNKSSQVHA